MSDQLTDLLRERLSGHEMSVPPGAWEHVSGQLAAHASGESLREGLHAKFQGHEVPVDPSAWANISGQLGHGAAAGSSFSAGWIAAGLAAVAVTATVLLWNSAYTEQQAAVTEKPSVAIAEAPAPVSVPAATLPLTPETVSVTGEQPQRPAPAKVVAPATPQEEQRPVTPASMQEPRPKAVDLPARPTAPATTPEPEQKPLIEQPEAASPATTAPEPVPIQTKSTGPDTPGQGENPAGSTSAGTGPVTEQAEDGPFHTTVANDIFIPNVFSPQGDGVNDKLEIVAKDYEKADVRVFAAKGGALVFRSNDLANMWDGRLSNGNIAEEGYYKCIVLLTDANGQLRVKSEVVRLFR